MSACKTTSTRPYVEPTPPEVRCKQQEGPQVPRAPRADAWVEWAPPQPGEEQGAARLSRQAVEWISAVLAAVRVERGLRQAEHDCLDRLEERGLITQ